MRLRPRNLTIIEGPDGAGKTTYAQSLAASTDARLVHCGPFHGVKKGLARLYVEAMLPALLGYQDVVLDRSWLSESIYGEVYRNGHDRLGVAQLRMLNRLAMRCAIRVVICLPSVSTCLEAFRTRRNEEYLDDERQLRRVYELYRHLLESTKQSLPRVRYNYLKRKLSGVETALKPHPLDWGTAGKLDASVVMVGDTLAELKDHDPLFRAPFVSFSGAGCSGWLTLQLAEASITEDQLLWVNADDPALTGVIYSYPRAAVVALGQVAFKKLRDWMDDDTELIHARHPQSAKRFYSHSRYELLDRLKEVL